MESKEVTLPSGRKVKIRVGPRAAITLQSKLRDGDAAANSVALVESATVGPRFVNSDTPPAGCEDIDSLSVTDFWALARECSEEFVRVNKDAEEALAPFSKVTVPPS